MISYKKYFKESLSALGDATHFAAHSHHLWPDIAKVGQLNCIQDAFKFNDAKWEHIFHHIIPKVQNHIATNLGYSHPDDIVLAPNTHELVYRILSLFPFDKPIRILTSDSEFYSFNRQIQRLEEAKRVEVQRVQVSSPWLDRRQIINQLKQELQQQPDLFFISQVMFNSGQAFTEDELLELYQQKATHTLMVIDGYHGFAALPMNLDRFKRDVFYLGGGYKYAMSGEGVAFMVTPPKDYRPYHTGWFAELSLLSFSKKNEVYYPKGAAAFWGATQEPSGWYRFLAIWDQWRELKIDIKLIHQHVENLQQLFLARYDSSKVQLIKDSQSKWHGHFLSFEFENQKSLDLFKKRAHDSKLIFDYRGLRARVGFGLYHDPADIDKLDQVFNS